MIWKVTIPFKAMARPTFNNGDLFCWENMAWTLLILVWISGFLLCCRGFKRGGRRSFQIFLAAWTTYAINIQLNKMFTSNESLTYFVSLYTITWFIMLAFRLVIDSFIAPFIGKQLQNASSSFLKYASIFCGLLMIASIYGTDIYSPLLWLSLILAGSTGWWYQTKKKKEDIRHVTYQDLDALEKRVLYEKRH